jgi:hypothetical protein
MRDCQKTEDSWSVEEILDIDENGISATVRISQNDSYQPSQHWPEVGQELVVKPKEAR